MTVLTVLGGWCAVSVVSSAVVAAFIRAGKRTEWEFGRDALLDHKQNERSPKIIETLHKAKPGRSNTSACSANQYSVQEHKISAPTWVIGAM